jgi:hypothetical protein
MPWARLGPTRGASPEDELEDPVGTPEPLQAITDELQTQPGYNTLVICTLPLGVSRWLKLDWMHRAERKFGLRVMHVVAEAPAPARP